MTFAPIGNTAGLVPLVIFINIVSKPVCEVQQCCDYIVPMYEALFARMSFSGF